MKVLRAFFDIVLIDSELTKHTFSLPFEGEMPSFLVNDKNTVIRFMTDKQKEIARGLMESKPASEQSTVKEEEK